MQCFIVLQIPENIFIIRTRIYCQHKVCNMRNVPLSIMLSKYFAQCNKFEKNDFISYYLQPLYDCMKMKSYYDHNDSLDYV